MSFLILEIFFVYDPRDMISSRSSNPLTCSPSDFSWFGRLKGGYSMARPVEPRNPRHTLKSILDFYVMHLTCSLVLSLEVFLEPFYDNI